ncbi:hypothetical protein WH91_04295, partial [Devosia psychrophila]
EKKGRRGGKKDKGEGATAERVVIGRTESAIGGGESERRRGGREEGREKEKQREEKRGSNGKEKE